MKLVTSVLFICCAAFAFGETSESGDLAAGYAAAFHCLDRSVVSIVYLGPDRSETIIGVKDVQAFGGVVAIRTRAGAREILDPARIVRMTAD